MIVLLMVFGSVQSGAAEEPMQWHENLTRNNVVHAEDLPDHLGDDNRLWHIELHGKPFFNIITIEDGKVYCAMSAQNLPEPAKDGGAILCLDLETGKELWHKVLGERSGPYGLSIIPLITDDAIYVHLHETAWRLDLNGEVQWENNNIKQSYYSGEHGNHSTGLLIGDYWWIPTGFATGSDCDYWINNSIERPWHPNILVLEKDTGKIVAQDDSIIGPVQHGSWASLSSGIVDGQRLVFWGDASGYVHAYEVPDSFPEGELTTIKEKWICDANPKEYRFMEDGTPWPYVAYMGYAWGPSDKGPNEVIATPVFHDGLLYVATGRDKAYSRRQGKRRMGNASLVCIDPRGSGDITDTNKVWTNNDINRSFSTPSIYKDMIFVATHAGYLNCFDLKTGEKIWKGDIDTTIWNYFQAVGDDKVFVANERRDFYIFNATREGGQLYHEELDGMNNPQAGLTDGVVVVGSMRSITAYGGPEYMKTHKAIGPVEKKGGH